MKKKISLLISLFLLVGCSNSNSTIKKLEEQVQNLSSQYATVSSELQGFKNIDYTNKYANGHFPCALSGAGTLDIRFLSSTVVHITGVDEDKIPFYNNYYVYKFIDQKTLVMVDDLDLPGSLKTHSFENLIVSSNPEVDMFYKIMLLEDGRKLTFTPIDNPIYCTFVKD